MTQTSETFADTTGSANFEVTSAGDLVELVTSGAGFYLDKTDGTVTISLTADLRTARRIARAILARIDEIEDTADED